MPFDFELRLCGKSDWDLCYRVGRNIRTTNAIIDGFYLRKEVLRWMDSTITNPTNSNNFLLPNDVKKHVDKHTYSFNQLITHFPAEKNDSEEMKVVKQ